MARQGRLRLPREWLERHAPLIEKLFYPLAVLAFAILVPQFSAVLGLPVSLTGLNLADSRPDLGFALLLIGSFLPIFFLIWLWLWIVERRPLWSTGMTRPVVRPYLRGLLIGFLLFTFVVALLGMTGMLVLENDARLESFWAALSGVAIVVLGWMVQGAAEELLARGFLLPILGIRWGPWPAVLISSLYFAVLHLPNPNVSALSLLNLFLFGFLAALYALREGQLWGVFALHSVWNWAQGNLFGFEVSGINIESTILVDLMENGPDWITGGAFGPEGGMAVSLTLLGAIGVLLIWSQRSSRTPASN